MIKGKSKTKKKKIIKSKDLASKSNAQRKDYLEFFKYYYNRLSGEHPRWSNAQTTSIIKLLWKKRNINLKAKKPQLSIRNLILRPLSGRVMYRKEKQAMGFNLEQIKQTWRHLPHESKMYWERKGRGGTPKFQKIPNESMSQLKKVMKSGS